RRLVHVRRDRLRVVPLAARLPPLAGAAGEAARAAAVDERSRRGVPDRYFVYTGRYDARQDLATLLRALRLASGTGTGIASAPRAAPPALVGGPPAGGGARRGRGAGRGGAGGLPRAAPRRAPPVVAGLVAGARAVLVPALSDAAGMSAIDAIALGTPVVASAV